MKRLVAIGGALARREPLLGRGKDLVLSVVLGIPDTLTTILMGVLVVTYTALGGIKAVQWIDVPDMATPRRYHTASKLINGRVVIAGGHLPPSQPPAGYQQSAEIFDPSGPLWDLGGASHPQITSVREHKGYLYLGGINNNRIGRHRLADADPSWTSQHAYWGQP